MTNPRLPHPNPSEPGAGGLRLAVLRVDFGGRGGFERHLDSVTAELVDRGWLVETIVLDGTEPRSRLFGLDVKPVQHEFHDDYFKYLSLVTQVADLDLSRFDVVLTAQPPTYLARHSHKVALFYHQARQFYDLAEPYIDSEFAAADVHHQAIESVHQIDTTGIKNVRRWLAGSATTAERLEYYWSIPKSRISQYQAPPECTIPPEPNPYNPAGPVLHVGRFEWPKRAELLTEAMHQIRSDRLACFVGDGSRLDYVRSLDAELGAKTGDHSTETESGDDSSHAPGDDSGHGQPALDLTDRRGGVHHSWMNRGIFTAGWEPNPGPASGKLKFVGPLGDADRDSLYRACAMVVAPALAEDYGLTAIEAMAYARPVIVCSDGGGLTELVEHGVTGLVVPPEPGAMAEAIDQLLEDPELATELGLAGYRQVASMSHGSAASQIEAALLATLADRGELQLL